MNASNDDPSVTVPGENNLPDEHPARRRDEIALVVGCLLGEREPFNELVLRYSPLVHAVALEVLRNAPKDVAEDADDMTQQFFKDLWQSPWDIVGNFDARRGVLGTYLKKVAHHRFTKMLRSHEVSWPARRPRHDAATLEHLPARPAAEFDPAKFIARWVQNLLCKETNGIERG